MCKNTQSWHTMLNHAKAVAEEGNWLDNLQQTTHADTSTTRWSTCISTHTRARNAPRLFSLKAHQAHMQHHTPSNLECTQAIQLNVHAHAHALHAHTVHMCCTCSTPAMHVHSKEHNASHSGVQASCTIYAQYGGTPSSVCNATTSTFTWFLQNAQLRRLHKCLCTHAQAHAHVSAHAHAHDMHMHMHKHMHMHMHKHMHMHMH